MAFTTLLPTAAIENFDFPDMAEIPGGEWTQGSDATSDNPRRRVHLDGFEVATGLTTVRDYKRYVKHAQAEGRYGIFGRVKDRKEKQGNEGDEILFGRGHKPELAAMRFFNPHVNEDLTLNDLADAHIEEIAPALDWLEAIVAKYQLDPIFLNDDTPVTYVSQWDSYGYVNFLNEQLAIAMQLGRIAQGATFYALPTAAQLQRVMAGPEGTFAFGTHNGEALDLTGGQLKHIGEALERKTGVPWGDKEVLHLFRILLQRTRDRYHQDSNRLAANDGVVRNPRGARTGNPELSGGGSWNDLHRVNFAAAYRYYDVIPGYCCHYIGLRVVRPMTPGQ